MKFAYADPPYPGKARKYYGDHADYKGEVDHAALIEYLEGNFPDGWALSTGAESLRDILPLCPAPESRGAAGGGVRHQFRVLSWCKPLAQPGGNPGPLYGWEPLILRGGRRDPEYHYPRDWIVATPDLYTFRPKPDEHVTGAKPAAFAGGCSCASGPATGTSWSTSSRDPARWPRRGRRSPSRAPCCKAAPDATSGRQARRMAFWGVGLGKSPFAGA